MDRPRYLFPDDATLSAMSRPAPRVGHPGPDVQDAIDRMLYLICRTGQPALAAPQIGHASRIIAVDLSGTGRRPIVLLDPEITSRSPETAVDAEGCLQLPDLRVAVRRPLVVGIRARSRSGQPVHLHAGGLLGRILQHQLDHLDGRLLLDRIPETRRKAYLQRLRLHPRRRQLGILEGSTTLSCRDLLPRIRTAGKGG